MTGVRAADAPRVLGATLPVQQWLALVAVATLPFTYALTVDLKFPLKIYEVVLAVAGLFALAECRLRAAPGAWRVVRSVVWLGVWAGGVLVWRLARPLATAGAAGFESRFGPAGDGVTKLAYLGLSVFGFAVISYAAYRDERLVARSWVAGALVGAVYTWYLFLSSVMEAPPLLLPGMREPQVIGIGNSLFIRSGTFEEGNFLGLFLVCSAAVAWFARLRGAAFALGATVLITFSTVNVLALALFAGGLALSTVWRHRNIARRGAALVAATFAGAALVAALVLTGYAAEVVFGKLTTGDPGSKFDRLDLAAAGVRMFADHPVAGVGLSQYGYNYKAYQLTDFFERLRTMKPIANNVYVELLSELGVVGGALFAVFLWRVYATSRAAGLAPLRWGLVAVLFVFNAFPSYTLMFLWAYWALVVGAAARVHAAAGAAARAP